jgi:hypothetical protein
VGCFACSITPLNAALYPDLRSGLDMGKRSSASLPWFKNKKAEICIPAF